MAMTADRSGGAVSKFPEDGAEVIFVTESGEGGDLPERQIGPDQIVVDRPDPLFAEKS